MTWFWVGRERDGKIKKIGNLELGRITQPIFYPKQVYLKSATSYAQFSGKEK